MRYIVTTKDNKPFLTDWFDEENHFNKEVGMIVYDIINNVYTTDGENWLEISIDNL